MQSSQFTAMLIYRANSKIARGSQRNPVLKRRRRKEEGVEIGGRGWRGGSVVKSTDCSSEGPEFKSQQPCGGSQPFVMKSDTLFWCV